MYPSNNNLKDLILWQFLASCIARFWNHVVCVSVGGWVSGQESKLSSTAFVVWHRIIRILKHFIENFLLPDFDKMHRAFGF